MPDITITIKNMPDELLTQLWEDVIEFGESQGDRFNTTNDFVVDFYEDRLPPSFQSFRRRKLAECLAMVMTEHIMTTKIKVRT